jgi:hypothetical protein
MFKKKLAAALVACGILILTACGGGPKGPTGPDQGGPPPTMPNTSVPPSAPQVAAGCVRIPTTRTETFPVGEQPGFVWTPAAASTIPGLPVGNNGTGRWTFHVRWMPWQPEADVQIYLHEDPPFGTLLCNPTETQCANKGVAFSDATIPPASEGGQPLRTVSVSVRDVNKRILVMLRSRGPKDALTMLDMDICPGQ